MKVISEHHPDDAWDARQRLIDGWDADKIRNANIFVMGAGALGNETLKNLALLGNGYVFNADLDTIELSNLTRTVLFTQKDIGKEKSPLAVKRYLDMNLEPTAAADTFTGDIVYELGDGVFRRMDMVLGCLDNTETRMYANGICMRYNIPYIDAGINGLNYNLRVMKGHSYGCYACNAAAYKLEDRFRMSCNVTQKKAAAQGKIATVQCASAIASGMQVQEAMKVLCGMNPEYGIEIHYQGLGGFMDKFRIPRDENCIHHLQPERSEVIETPLSADNTLKEFLEYTAFYEKQHYEAGERCDILTVASDKLRNFVTDVRCPSCGKTVRIYKPLYRVYEADFYCSECGSDPVKAREHNFENAVTSTAVLAYSLESTPEILQKLTLKELGIPALHVLAVRNEEGTREHYYELTGDLEAVMPAYAHKHVDS